MNRFLDIYRVIYSITSKVACETSVDIKKFCTLTYFDTYIYFYPDFVDPPMLQHSN